MTSKPDDLGARAYAIAVGNGWSPEGEEFTEICHAIALGLRSAEDRARLTHDMFMATSIAPVQHAVVAAVECWDRQSSRIWEAMGDDNPRVHAVDEAVEAMRTAIQALRPSAITASEQQIAGVIDRWKDHRKTNCSAHNMWTCQQCLWDNGRPRP